jgi:hypothetical protein
VELATTFDALLSNVRKDVHVVRGEEDWTPPSATDSPEKKYAFVQKVIEHVKDTLDHADVLSEEGRKKAYDKARELVKEAQKIYPMILSPVPTLAAKGWAITTVNAAHGAKKVLDELWEDLKAGGKWAATAELEAMGVVWIGLIAFIAYTLHQRNERGSRAHA